MKSLMSKIDRKKPSREISNQEIEFVAFSYQKNKGIPNEYGIDATEWWHERIVRLDNSQMELYKMRFEECLTLRQIQKKLGVSHTAVDKRLKKMFLILKEK